MQSCIKKSNKKNASYSRLFSLINLKLSEAVLNRAYSLFRKFILNYKLKLSTQLLANTQKKQIPNLQDLFKINIPFSGEENAQISAQIVTLMKLSACKVLGIEEENDFDRTRSRVKIDILEGNTVSKFNQLQNYFNYKLFKYKLQQEIAVKSSQSTYQRSDNWLLKQIRAEQEEGQSSTDNFALSKRFLKKGKRPNRARALLLNKSGEIRKEVKSSEKNLVYLRKSMAECSKMNKEIEGLISRLQEGQKFKIRKVGGMQDVLVNQFIKKQDFKRYFIEALMNQLSDYDNILSRLLHKQRDKA